jgi:hypothetical protein
MPFDKGRNIHMNYSKKILIVIGIILFWIISCNSKRISGSGTIIREPRSVSGFQKVSVSGSGHLLINQGDEESLEIECDDNIVSYIKTTVTGGTLEIGPEKVSLDPSQPITYRLSLKNLEALTTSGSVSVKGDALRTERLRVVMNGSGTLDLGSLEAQSIELHISGSGEVTIESGNLKNQKITISGSGEYSAPNLKSQNTDLTISGSGDAKVWATAKLDVTISGSGKLSYYGSPGVSSSISGSGKVKSLGPK